MIYIADDEEMTERDLYLYHRGIMHEYLRHRGNVDPEACKMLHDWVRSGNTVYTNPWDIHASGDICNFLDALEIIRNAR